MKEGSEKEKPDWQEKILEILDSSSKEAINKEVNKCSDPYCHGIICWNEYLGYACSECGADYNRLV